MNTTHIGTVLLFIGMMGLINDSNAQSGELFTVDADLSSSMVTDIHQCRNGFVWIATEDGLNRFDGSKIKVYRNDAHAPHTMLSDVVRVLGADTAGTMFIGYINGLQYYDAASDSFHDVPLYVPNQGIVSPHVRAIYQRKNGQLLVGTSGYGIFEIRQGKQGLQGVRLVDLEPSNLILRLFEDDDENLWIATEDRGLFKKNTRGLTVYFSAKKAQYNVIGSICQDRHGNLLAGNLNNGLYRYEAATDSFYHIPFPNAPHLPVSDLYVGSNNLVYLASDGYGMKVYDPVSNRLTALDATVTRFNFSDTKATCILEDRAGNIWVGIHQKGVFLLHGHENHFRYIGHRSIKSNLIGSQAVTAILEDRRGTLWVGAGNDGLYQLNRERDASIHYKATANDDPFPSSVMSIFEDTDGDFWLGSLKDGLARFDPQSGVCQPITGLVDEFGDDVGCIPAITEDRLGQLWIGTKGAGLFSVDKDTDTIRNFTSVAGKQYHLKGNYLPNKWINCLLVTENDLLFAGTYDGLACFDLKTESFSSTFGINKLLPTTVVYTLFDDKKGNLWIGTSMGLFRMDLRSKEIVSFQMDDGLPSNVVYAIEADAHGHIWVSTNRGIAKMNLKDDHFVSFFAGDGLQGDEFTAGASLRSQNGEIFFGGINGISYFNPMDIRLETTKPFSAYIVDFYVHDKPVRKGLKSGSREITDAAVIETNVFNLAYADNSFTVEFSTMDYSEFERITFQYALNDNDWTTLSRGHNRVTFDHLEPGKHSLRYRAKLNQSYSDVKHALIVVRPIGLLSPFAKVIYGVIFLIGSVFVILRDQNRQRLKAQVVAQQHAQEINLAKLEFFIHIAHEIRTPLTLVISPLRKLLNRIQDRDRDGLHRIINRNIQRMLDLVNQLLDIRKIEAGQMNLQFVRTEIVAFTKDICSLFEDQFDAKRIQFSFSSEERNLYAPIDVQHFDKVLINILSNACKFTPEGGRIQISLQKHPSGYRIGRPSVSLSIADSGESIDPHESERIFDCFYQAKNQGKYTGYGAGIGLHLTRQLVELHHGNIRVENLTESGCAFIVEIPLDEEQGTSQPLSPSVVHNRLPVSTPYVSSASRSQKAPAAAKRVAVVDDDGDIREFLEKMLSSAYAVNTYKNGLEAYQGILSDAPDLVISDVMMPLMDGMMLCRKIRQNPLVHHVPVVLLTAKGSDSDQVKGLGWGADLYITKPFNMDVLSENIGSLLRNREIVGKNVRESQSRQKHISKIILKSADEKLMEKVHKLIESNIANPQLSVEMLAEEIGISRVHLHRKLKDLTHLTTKDLIRKIRLEQAAELLTSKRLSVSEVAYAVGYSDVSSFSTAFKLLYGVVPKKFAEQKHHSDHPL